MRLRIFSSSISPEKDKSGNQMSVSNCSGRGRSVKIQNMEGQSGKVSLYLLDTDFEENSPEDRTVYSLLHTAATMKTD